MYRDMEERLRALEGRLGIEFKNRTLLLTAVTHSSYHNENPGTTWPNNEVLEFLGDSVLQLCVTDHLVQRFPKDAEGQLSIKRGALVNTQTLGAIGEEYGIARVILMSRGEFKESSKGSKSRTYIVGCTVEALIGALYRDQGIGPCRFLIDQLLLTRVTALVNGFVEYKGVLQERVQRELGISPHYEVLSAVGSDHERLFVVAVFAGKDRLAFGEGSSKKEAESHAAAAALENFKQPKGDV